MISRIAGRRALLSLQSLPPVCSTSNATAKLGRTLPLQRRWRTAAPKPGEGPLMERRSDRELPGKLYTKDV